MSDSWVRDRMQAGDLPRPGVTANEYVEAYLEFKMRKAAPGAGGGSAFDAERTRLTREQADRIAMENARERLELASLPDMTMAVASVIEVSKARLVRVPSIVAKGDEKLRKRIETAITDALEDLSTTRVHEQAGGGIDEDDGPDDDRDDG